MKNQTEESKVTILTKKTNHEGISTDCHGD